MLEYLLIRPTDYALFAPDNLGNWKFVILDEAHSYHGALGIELSMLMRRLTGLADKKPRFILTSATLGEQGKLEKDIIQFAKNLTSADFSIDDIIFSKRIEPINLKNGCEVSGADYISILKNQDNRLETILSEIGCDIDPDRKRNLFNLLSRDKNVYRLYRELKDGTKDFKSIYGKFKDRLSEEELIALIDLINGAEKNGIGLYDLKYHSFVRPLAGAFITLGKRKELSLTKSNTINGFRAFEVGNCKFCSAPYIIGKLIRNSEKQLDYLIQNKEVDIYENYGQNEFVKLDYFVLEDTVAEEEADETALEEYSLCPICGEIHHQEI